MILLSILLGCAPTKDSEDPTDFEDTGNSADGDTSQDTSDTDDDTSDTSDTSDTQDTGDTQDTDEPPFINSSVIVEVTTGGWHTCVRFDDDTLDCWGLNNYAQSSPPNDTFSQLTAGEYHTCGITTNGDVACWGANNSGQSITQVGNFVDVEAGKDYTCAIESGGSPLCWDGTESWETPPAESFATVNAGIRHSCGVKTDGTLSCWSYDYGYSANCSYYYQNGINNYLSYYFGDCGISTFQGWNESTDPTAPSSGHQFTDVAVTAYTGCTIDISTGVGEIYCWGRNPFDLREPPGGNWTTSDFVQIEAGDEHFCALDSTGVAHCWGENDHNEIEVPYGLHDFVQVSAGYDHSCGLKSNGDLLCWGDNSDEQLGIYEWTGLE